MQLHSRVRAVIFASLMDLRIPVNVAGQDIEVGLGDQFAGPLAGDIAGRVLDSMATATEEREAEAKQAWVDQFGSEKSAHACEPPGGFGHDPNAGEEVQDAEGEVEDETNSGRFALLLHFADWMDDEFTKQVDSNGELVRKYIRTVVGE